MPLILLVWKKQRKNIVKINKFDKVICRKLGEAIIEAMKKIEDEYGVHFERKGGSFSETNYTLKLEASVVSQDGIVLSREAEEFKRYCQLYNLETEDLGRTFKDTTGTEWKVVGLSSRSNKYPIMAKRIADGKNFKLGQRMVQQGLGRKISSFDE